MVVARIVLSPEVTIVALADQRLNAGSDEFRAIIVLIHKS